jgi:hypothetical protein
MLAKNLRQLFASPSSHQVQTFLFGKSNNSLLKMAAVRQASQFISAPDAQNFDLTTLALKKSDEKLLVDQPWTTKPFLTTSPIQLPVFNFLTGQFTG